MQLRAHVQDGLGLYLLWRARFKLSHEKTPTVNSEWEVISHCELVPGTPLYELADLIQEKVLHQTITSEITNHVCMLWKDRRNSDTRKGNIKLQWWRKRPVSDDLLSVSIGYKSAHNSTPVSWINIYSDVSSNIEMFL